MHAPPRSTPLLRCGRQIRALEVLFGPVWSLKVLLLFTLLWICLHPDAVPDAVYSTAAITPLHRPYADTLVITLGAEELARGGDPLIHNPDDPWGRPLNYPRPVGQLAAGAGLNRSHTALLARTIGIVFILGLGALLRELDFTRTAFVALLVVSPPILLGLERANFDLLVFGALAITCFLAPRTVPLAVVPLCALKIFPIFALSGAVSTDRPPRLRLWAFASAGCLAAILLALPDLAAIRQSTPFRVLNSWGAATLPLRLNTHSWLAALQLAGLLVFLSGLAWGLLRRQSLDTGPDSEPKTVAATIAAGIFSGCYFLGTNFDYRLLFLLLAAPWLLQMASRPVASTDRAWSVLALTLIGVAFWGDALARRSDVLDAPLWLVDELAPAALLGACGWILGRAARFPARLHTTRHTSARALASARSNTAPTCST